MWIDTHCHLDAGEFAGAAAAVVGRAEQHGVSHIVIPAVERGNFAAVADLAHRHSACCYALGIHPLYVPQAQDEDLDLLRETVARALADDCFVAIGEIGLDFFVPELCDTHWRTKQERFYAEQLRIARDFDLPVLLHVRRSQDIILKYLRRFDFPGGIAHAFNGSFQQAEEFIKRGFRLGFGGAMTFTRALQIRRLAAELPDHALVLETDAPDIPPAWLDASPNSPEQLPRIGEVMAQLRGVPVEVLAHATTSNARDVLPRLARLR